ncbi:MAG TPA: HigA family addiction module antitoxin, partial [Chthoniobacterales bacterium]
MTNGELSFGGPITVRKVSELLITIDAYPITHQDISVNPSVTPGEILLEDYLKPMSISQNALARAIGVSPRTINEIVLGRRSITPEMSLRLGKFFDQS